ncbi:MAG: LamG domain-containing protein [Chloroflexota bacterium]
MRHRILSLVFAVGVGWGIGLLPVPAALAQSAPEFKLGFKSLADQIPAVAGQPLENERWGDNGDSLQRTTTGLMVWRKADNWTAFTDGSVTWINGPRGVQSRYNHQRFEWERDQISPSEPAPKVSPGLILCSVDSSQGMGGWPATSGWSVVDGLLVSDGSSQGTAILAPCQPEGVADYAVEAEIQLVNLGHRQKFGLLARDGYVGGIDSYSYANVRHASVGTLRSTLAQRDFDPGDGWHSYRLEVRGNRVRLLMDGTLLAEAMDNSYLSPGRVGLWNNRVQLNVRSFKLIAL